MECQGNKVYAGRYIIVQKNGFGGTVHNSLENAKAACQREGDQVIKVGADPQDNELLYTRE